MVESCAAPKAALFCACTPRWTPIAVNGYSRKWQWPSHGLHRAIEVLDRIGKRVDKGDPQVDSADRMLLRISLPPLAPGRYRVTWRVLSVDTHVAAGQFTFEIAP
ncbi:MAG: copper resistance protein CopC [Betaproteobacteria bacterium]|nr:MAG: copper resistance protein CopC [Betaproteobacteria bacterium]